MCGICGYIGKSTNPQLSYQLITELFDKTEIRGIDASGFWGIGTEGDIIYYKEPTRASHFVKSENWSNVREINPHLLLVHCRAATSGVGVPAENENNHPFVSGCGNVGLIHNGNIKKEYHQLKGNFELESECDSEILIRIYEQSNPSNRLDGISNIWSQINEGHMAVAIGERCPTSSYLWLFRNKHRSLWTVDLREELGQYFFCSTPDIWLEATSLDALSCVRYNELIEVPTEQVWQFKSKSGLVGEIEIFDVEKSEELDLKSSEKFWDLDDSLINERCESICQLASDIQIVASNRAQGSDLDPRTQEELEDYLEQVRIDLEGIFRIIN